MGTIQRFHGSVTGIEVWKMRMAVSLRAFLRGDVCLIQLDRMRGSEIRKTRPCLVASPDELNKHLRTLVVAPMTTVGHAYPCAWHVDSGDVDLLRLIGFEQLTQKAPGIHEWSAAPVREVLPRCLSRSLLP